MASRPILTVVVSVSLFVLSLGQGRAQEADAGVRAALDARGLTYEVTESGNFRLTLPATDARTHIVIVQSATREFNGFTIREVWAPILKSPTAPDADVCNKLLRDNNLDKTGAWQLYKNDELFMLTFCSKVPADADAESLESFILGCVEIADDMEKQVTGTDEF